MQSPLQPLLPPSEQQDFTLGVARVMLQGFNKHYRIFREACKAAKRHFETGNWDAVQKAARERIVARDAPYRAVAEGARPGLDLRRHHDRAS